MSKLLDEMKKKLLQQSKKEKIEPVVISDEVKQTMINPIFSDGSKDQQNQVETQPVSQIPQPQIMPTMSKQFKANETQVTASPIIKCPPLKKVQEKDGGFLQATSKIQIDKGVQKQECNHEKGQIVQKQAPFHENLEIFKQIHPFSVSVDQDVRNSSNNVQEKYLEYRSDQSKQQKKCKKIILKELIKVKQCIKNLQGAVKGLEYLQSRMKYNPSMRLIIKRYLMELKQQGSF